MTEAGHFSRLFPIEIVKEKCVAVSMSEIYQITTKNSMVDSDRLSHTPEAEWLQVVLHAPELQKG